MEAAKFREALNDLENFLNANASNDHMLQNRIVSLEDFTALSQEIVRIDYPRIHNSEGHNLEQLYYWLCPVMSLEVRKYVTEVIVAWREWATTV
jgi:hypothetical protein